MNDTSITDNTGLLSNTSDTLYGPPELIMNNSSSTTVTVLEKEAVFPPVYSVLPTTKLEEEPNPFEESFEVATEPVKDPVIVNDTWHLKSGMISPSTLSDNKQNRRTPKRSRKSSVVEDEEKRKNFLERNRIAALKCRQRKKQWLQNLQAKVEYLVNENEQYHLQANALREELIQLKTLLMAHKDCPINQSATQIALSRPLPPSLLPSNLPSLLPSL
ncbi:hypothetical protein EDC96DRAFT_493848 [Choanephora cucurbitarum]|nr:hypothetical protein EDC96DRAFT_493848 [Choanephora cucurbitarum]